MSESPLSIFTIGQHQQELNAAMLTPKSESKLFDPRIKKPEDVLVVVLRLMPYVKDVRKSLIKKHYYALPDQQGTIWFDSKSTFNNKAANHYEFCPVSDLWVKLQNSTDPNVKSRASQLRMQIANYAYVQIVKYPADTSFEGKIMPMRIPKEMRDRLESMANPTDQDIALGAKPVQPFDIMSSYSIKCTIRGKMVDNQLMRDWTCENFEGAPCQAKFPLGPNGEMTDVSLLNQQDVIKYFEEQQPDDLEQVYGYRAPNVDTQIRMRNYMLNLVSDIPALVNVVNGYFPDIKQQVAQSAEAQPAQQPLPEAKDPIAAAMAEAASAQAQAQTQVQAPAPAPQPAPAPAPTPQPAPAPAPAPQPAQQSLEPAPPKGENGATSQPANGIVLP